MELKAILLARVISFFELVEVNPYGGLFLPDVVKALVHQCNFQKYPLTFEEWTSSEGSIFVTGKFEQTVIERLLLYNNGLQVETRVSTTESKRILEALIIWAKEQFGIKPPNMTQWAYVSALSFHSDVPLLLTGPIERLSNRLTDELRELLGEEAPPYRPLGFSVGHDPLLRKYPRASFTLQRRAETPFTENIYFSEAPLPTETHLALLEQYEKNVAEMLNPLLLGGRT